MIYKTNLVQIPKVHLFYTVTRNTVWHITDKSNILIIVTAGRCRFTSNGHTDEVGSGEAYFIPAGTAYQRESIDQTLCTMVYIHFSTSEPFSSCTAADFYNYTSQKTEQFHHEIFSDKYVKTNSLPYDIFLFSKTTLSCFDEVQKQLEAINLHSDHRTISCALQSSLALCNILLCLYKDLTDALQLHPELHDNIVAPPKIRGALNYIAQNYIRPISLEQLATHSSMSKQHLIRCFKNYLHTTPTQYILEFKIAKAKEFLFNQQDLSIKEIANELGIDDQHYFSRMFKKLCGETPSEYKYRVHHYVPPQP